MMRRDINYIQGVTMEDAVNVVRDSFFREYEIGLKEVVVRSQNEFADAYAELLKYRDYEECLNRMYARTRKETFYYSGTCAICNSQQNFIMDYRYAQEWNGQLIPNWRERMVCPNCGCNSRQRLIVHKIFENYNIGNNVLMYEQSSDVFQKVQREIPQVKGFEYVGEEYGITGTYKGIPCEDICNLSFKDESYDLIVSNDVFEHVYDYEQAFQEAYRILKPGGRLLFTVPFNANSDMTARRVRKEGNDIILTESEWYHGNPIGDFKPLLVYQLFGWDMLESLKKCGFTDAVGKVYYSISDGYMGYLPLYFEAYK